MDDLARRARQWAEHDPDPRDRDSVLDWLRGSQAGDEAASRALRAAFAGPLTFGTAGLRGPIGPGESAMNRAVVIRTTAGLVDELRRQIGEHPRVAVGFDARHRSAAFARDVAEVAAAAGCEALLLPGPLPTPVLAFAVRHLDADAGVMITASHNPATDNGYKVYLGGRAAGGSHAPGAGVQIVPPADGQIAASIAAAAAADEIPRAAAGVRQIGDDIIAAYLARAATLTGVMRRGAPRRRLRVVLTPLHGVGGFVAHQALGATGFADIDLVSEQAVPDPDFPTVAFPNPEEPGALDLALERARRAQADLVIALDPDADRCSVAVPRRTQVVGDQPGEHRRRDGDDTRDWRQLTGDELGALLGEDAAARAAGGSADRHDNAAEGVLATTIVSSRLLSRIAVHHGLRHATTLTGFKWIARVPGLVFGYEEAIGYCTDPARVRDKDGITAALRVVDLASRLAGEGRTLLDALDDLAHRHGLYATAPVTVRVERPEQIAEAMTRLRAKPPAALADSPVERTVDLRDGIPALDLPATDGMLFVTASDDRVIVRPSGTEPKLKAYLEVVLPCRGEHVPHEAAAQRLEDLAQEVRGLLGL